MYLNTFLFLFGLDPDNFVNEVTEPIIQDDGTTIYYLRQRTDVRICPECGCLDAVINNYYWSSTSFTTNEVRPTILKIRKVRFRCRSCGKTFTPILNGIERHARIGRQVELAIKNDFYKQKPFSIIARDYGLSKTEIIKLFDRMFPYIGRGNLCEALCIDEIGFKTDDGSYTPLIYDHDKRIVIDILPNRQLEFLRSYFVSFSFKERSKVKYFISDLYSGYASIKKEFFYNAIHIADLFHVIRLLKVQVSKLRVETYKRFTVDGDMERDFMQKHWEYFEKPLTNKIKLKEYYSKKHQIHLSIWDMMLRCLKLNNTFWDAYDCLQDLYTYWSCDSFDKAILWIKKIANELQRTNHEELSKVGNTYMKWRNEIANAITVKRIDGKRYSNGPAEGLNNPLKTIIKDSCGYMNFERFRKRALLILNEKKTSHK